MTGELTAGLGWSPGSILAPSLSGITKTPHTDLESWATLARYAAEIARQLAPTPFVPDSLRVILDKDKPTEREDLDGTAANATGVILAGAELNLEPIAALRSIDIIKGTPAMRSITLRAIVQAHGHRLWLVESTETRAIWRGIRRGETEVQESKWTTDRAQKLGLLGNRNWRSQPGVMCVARGGAEIARLVGPDTLLGLPYCAEELDDGLVGVTTGAAEDGAPSEPVRTAQRAPRKKAAAPPAMSTSRATSQPPAAPPEPDLRPGEDMNPPARPVPPGIEAGQMKNLHRLLGKTGRSDRATGLEWLSKGLGRPVTSTKDLNSAEASQAINVLQAEDDRLEAERSLERIAKGDPPPPTDEPADPGEDTPPSD
jgi:hypothetical protein